MSDYFASIGDSVVFLIALGSLFGFLGFILCLLAAIAGGNFHRWKFVGFAIMFAIVCYACGGPTFAIKYFRIH